MKYDVDYFISKFNRIPANKFCKGRFKKSGGHRCALGFCGYDLDEVHAMINLFGKHGCNVSYINDGYDPYFPQHTIKGRILAALYFIKDQQNFKEINYV